MANNDMRLNEKQIIRAALTVSDTTQKSVSESIGINPNTLKNQLCRPDNTMTLISVYRLLNAMGFEIVVRDKDNRYGGKEYIVSEDTSAIPAEKYAPIVDEIKSENAAAMLDSMK